MLGKVGKVRLSFSSLRWLITQGPAGHAAAVSQMWRILQGHPSEKAELEARIALDELRVAEELLKNADLMKAFYASRDLIDDDWMLQKLCTELDLLSLVHSIGHRVAAQKHAPENISRPHVAVH